MTTLLQSVAGLRAAFEMWGDRAVLYAPLLAMAVAVFAVAWFVAKGARAGARRSLGRAARDPRAGEAWGTIVYYVVLLFGVVAALAAGGVDLAALMVAVGALAFGLAFAMQNIIANLVSGLILLTAHPFSAGDAVEAGGVKGKVEKIGMRSTRMRSFDGLYMEVPNKDILENPLTVFTYHRDRRVDVEVGIDYGDDIPGAVLTARKALEGIEGVLPEPGPEVLVDALGGSSVNLIVRFWVDTQTRSWVQTKGEATRRVKEALDEGGYEIPFPIRTIYMREEDGRGGNGARREREEEAR